MIGFDRMEGPAAWLAAHVVERRDKLKLSSKILHLTGSLSSAWRTGPGRLLAWLFMALLVAAVLSPGTAIAARLLFQSPPTETPVPPAPTPIPPTPIPPTPVPATPTLVVPTATPLPPALPPTEAIPTATPLPIPATPTLAVPLPPLEPSPTPTLIPELPTPAEPDSSGPNQPVVNWVKFWDTIAVAVAYPWLCCGVSLLLLVPLVLLFMEIKGRRRPKTLPEKVLPREKSGPQ